VSAPSTKPYMKLAGTLVMLGMAIFFFERYGLSNMQQGTHLAGWLISVLVIAPVLLVVSGCAVFLVGRMRRL
jgi:hypothetical protein